MKEVHEERWSVVAAEAEVDRPLASVASLLVDRPWRLFQAATGSRTGHLQVRLAGFDLGRPLRTVLDRAVTTPDEVSLPVEWEAASGARFFPKMRGTLTATPVTAGCTRLRFAGSYRAPGGLVGRLGDVLVGRRVAEASVRDLVAGLARELELGQARPPIT